MCKGFVPASCCPARNVQPQGARIPRCRRAGGFGCRPRMGRDGPLLNPPVGQAGHFSSAGGFAFRFQLLKQIEDTVQQSLQPSHAGFQVVPFGAEHGKPPFREETGPRRRSESR